MSENPYLIQGPAQISFSGGRTSGYMLKHILDAHGGKLPPDVYVDFANTGDEREETLRFVHECSVRWSVLITWVEFDPYVEDSTRVVTFETASRAGQPLDAAIATRPTAHLYNPVSRYCTATTKLRRLQKLMLKGRGHQRWTSVLGLRHDEPTGCGCGCTTSPTPAPAWTPAPASSRTGRATATWLPTRSPTSPFPRSEEPAVSIAPAPTDAREAARARFLSAALWWMADQSCSSAFAEMEEAYEALMALAGPALAETLAQAEAARRAREAA